MWETIKAFFASVGKVVVQGIEFVLNGVKQVLSFVWKGVTYVIEFIG